MAQNQLFECWHKAGLFKGKKTQGSSKKLEARLAVLEVKTDNCSDESSFTDKKHKSIKRDNLALDTKGNNTRHSQPDS